MESKKLSVGVKLGYGVCDFGGNLYFTVTAFVLMIYLTDTMGLKAGLAGTALFIGRIWDAFYDTVIGYVSDRTNTRLDRRRPFMLVGASQQPFASFSHLKDLLFTLLFLIFGFIYLDLF